MRKNFFRTRKWHVWVRELPHPSGASRCGWISEPLSNMSLFKACWHYSRRSSKSLPRTHATNRCWISPAKRMDDSLQMYKVWSPRSQQSNLKRQSTWQPWSHHRTLSKSITNPPRPSLGGFYFKKTINLDLFLKNSMIISYLTIIYVYTINTTPSSSRNLCGNHG